MTPIYENKQLFDFMLRRVQEVGLANGLKRPQAFGRWFAEMYFQNPRDMFISDGSGDGKVDLFFNTSNGKTTEHCILNTKSSSSPISIGMLGCCTSVTKSSRASDRRAGRNGAFRSMYRRCMRSKRC